MRIDALWAVGRSPSVLVLAEPKGADVLQDVADFAERVRVSVSGSFVEVPVWTNSVESGAGGRVVEASAEDPDGLLSALKVSTARVIAAVRGTSQSAAEEECRALQAVLARNGVRAITGTRFLARPPGGGDERLLAAAAREKSASGLLAGLAVGGFRYGSRAGPADVDAQRRLASLTERIEHVESVGDVVGSLAATDILFAPPVVAWAGARGGRDATAALGACADDPALVSWWLAGASAAEQPMLDPLTLSGIDGGRLRAIIWTALALDRRRRPRLSQERAELWALASSIPTRTLKEAWDDDARLAPGAVVSQRRARPPAVYATAVREAVWSYACDGDYTPVAAVVELSQRHERIALGFEPEPAMSVPIVSEYARALRTVLEPVALVG